MVRLATTDDVDAIAALHAESWRQSYRGIYSDEYLDRDVASDRLEVWRARFAASREGTITIVVEVDGALVGFAHTILDADESWGALLDNLHVAPAHKGTGLGRALMRETARTLLVESPGSPLHLWVLEGNTAAQGFYRCLGGEIVGSEESHAPDGSLVTGLRVVWRDPTALLA